MKYLFHTSGTNQTFFFMHFLNIISTQPIWATRIPLYMEAELRIHGPWGIHEYLGFPPDFLDCHLLSASFHYPFSSPLRNSSWRARCSANPMVSSQVQRRDTWYDPSHHLSAQLWKKNVTRMKPSLLSYSEDKTPRHVPWVPDSRLMELCWVPSLQG